MTLFPIIQPPVVETQQELPIYREVKWDFAANKPVFQNENPVIVEREEAVLTWAWKTLHTERFRYKIYTWNYGCELVSLIGQPYTETLKRAEAMRYVRECLMVNPYITDVEELDVSFGCKEKDDKGDQDDLKKKDYKADGLYITCRIKTVYGDIQLGGDIHV